MSVIYKVSDKVPLSTARAEFLEKRLPGIIKADTLEIIDELKAQSAANLEELLRELGSNEFVVAIAGGDKVDEEKLGTFTAKRVVSSFEEITPELIDKIIKSEKFTRNSLKENIICGFTSLYESGIVGDLTLCESSVFPNGLSIKDVVLSKVMPDFLLEEAKRVFSYSILDCRILRDNNNPDIHKLINFLNVSGFGNSVNLVPILPKDVDIKAIKEAQRQKDLAYHKKVWDLNTRVDAKSLVTAVRLLSNTSFSRTTKTFGFKEGDRFKIMRGDKELGTMEIIRIEKGDEVLEKADIESLIEDSAFLANRALQHMSPVVKDYLSTEAVITSPFQFPVATRVSFKIKFSNDTSFGNQIIEEGKEPQIEVLLGNFGGPEEPCLLKPEGKKTIKTIVDCTDVLKGPNITNDQLNFLFKKPFILVGI